MPWTALGAGGKDKSLSKREQTLLDQQATIDYLQEQLSLLRSKRYQKQNEQLKSLQCQLFDYQQQF